jgi:iron complex transport system substrate-binding protein
MRSACRTRSSASTPPASFRPEALKEKANVGYVRALSAEGVLSLKPSLVIAIEGAGPPDALSLLNEAGVASPASPTTPPPTGVSARSRRSARSIGAAEPARRLAAQTKARFDELAAVRSGITKRRVLFVLSLQNGRALVGGRNSSADAIISLAGGINVADATSKATSR